MLAVNKEYTFLQIANYGIGGTYASHTDGDGEQGVSYTHSDDIAPGDRLSTFMGYLTDVDAGGATAYPAMGATIWAKKGDAAYW